MTLYEIITSGKEIKVTLEKKAVIHGEPTYKRMNMQGGGSDGKYGYFIMNECGSTNEVRSVMHKLDLETWEEVASAKDFYFAHANDLAYDTKNNRLLVSHCNVNSKLLSSVDPDTLALNEVLEIPVRHYALAYNEKRNQYVGGKSACYDISIMDENFNELRVIECEDGFTKQGFECDDNFIYCFHTGCRYNHIWIYDWDGNFITRVKVPMVGESEHLFVRGDHFIAGFNNFEERTGEIYEMRFSIED